MTLENTDRADKVRKIAELCIRAMGAEHPDGERVTVSLNRQLKAVYVNIYTGNGDDLRAVYSDWDYLDMDMRKLDGMIAVLENFLKECGV